MEPTVLIDELHVTVRVLEDLPAAKTDSARQTLLGDTFLDKLRLAIRAVFREYPELAVVRVSLTR